MSAAGDSAMDGELLFELAQWLARVQQYSASHPACAQLGERTHRALLRSLSYEPTLTVDVQKDGVTVRDVPVAHAAVRERFAPHLYERGVVVVRFLSGVTVEELTGLIELLTLPVQTTFDRGGLSSLAAERGIGRIQIEEIAHDISADDRDAQRTRTRLRARFSDVLRNLLAGRPPGGLTAEELLQLLDHPEMAVTILEEAPLLIAESLAGLCLMVREQEQKLAVDLFGRLRVIIMALKPASHDRVLLGLSPLTGELRDALAWALANLAEDELARVALAAFRAHAAELEVPLYALGVAAPHAGRRVATLRRMSLHFYDLPNDDVSGTELVTACAFDDGEADSYWREREVLAVHARCVLGRRGSFAAPRESKSGGEGGEHAALDEGTTDHRRVLRELVKMASRTRRFEQVASKLPQSAQTLARAGASSGVLGVIDALRGVRRPEWSALAASTLRAVVSPVVAAQILADASASVDDADVEEASVDDVVATVRLLTALAPEAVFEQLELSESRKMRRILIEALSAVPALLPLVRQKLTSPSWFIVRNALALLPRLGGTTLDVLTVARHEHEKVRVEVVRALRTLPADATAMDIVAAYLTDVSQEVRQPAAVMIRGELLTVGAIALLERIAASEEQPDDLRRRVVEALGRSPLDAAATALATLLQPRGLLLEVAPLRDHVAVALRHSPAPSAAHYFAEGLRSTAWRVRKACERAQGGGS